jgi:hypothetical protein
MVSHIPTILFFLKKPLHNEPKTAIIFPVGTNIGESVRYTSAILWELGSPIKGGKDE